MIATGAQRHLASLGSAISAIPRMRCSGAICNQFHNKKRYFYVIRHILIIRKFCRDHGTRNQGCLPRDRQYERLVGGLYLFPCTFMFSIMAALAAYVSRRTTTSAAAATCTKDSIPPTTARMPASRRSYLPPVRIWSAIVREILPLSLSLSHSRAQ